MNPGALRLAQPADVPALARLYAACARALGPSVYTPEQVAAWASFGTDSPAFRDYVLGAETWLSEDERGAPAGFSGFSGSNGHDGHHGHDGHDGHDGAGEVHSLYVRPDLGRRGLATALLGHVLGRARERGLGRLAAWVTPLSRPVFERAGFVLVETVRAPYQGVMFERYRVERVERVQRAD